MFRASWFSVSDSMRSALNSSIWAMLRRVHGRKPQISSVDITETVQAVEGGVDPVIDRNVYRTASIGDFESSS